MQFFVNNWVLFLAALSSGVMLLLPSMNKGAGGSSKVSPTEAVQLINREKAVLIDVSENAEYASGHVAGAKNVPLGSIEASSDLPKNKALPLVVVCPTGARATGLPACSVSDPRPVKENHTARQARRARL